MARKLQRRSITCALILSLLLAGTACTSDKEPDKGSSVTKVDTNGGTFKELQGVDVTVPQNAISSKTELSVTAPRQNTGANAPFGKASTSIDISFKDGSQPAPGKPLDIRIPLTGSYLPQGANAAAALLYHRAKNGSFRLLPAVVEGNALVAKLPHLSEWHVVFFNKATLMTFAPKEASTAVPHKCAAEADSPAGQVSVSTNDQGKKQVHACLITNDAGPILSINNHMNYLLPIAATDGLKFSTSSSDAEEDMVRLITSKIFPDKRVKGYLGRDGYATAVVPTSSLPATVELVGDPSTFLAESAWFALKFIVGLFVGKSGDQVGADIKFVLDSTEVISCIKGTLDISQGKTPSMGEVAELLTSKCSEQIAKGLGARAANTNAWDQFWGRVFTVGGGIVNGWNNFWTAVDGIRLQLNGTIRITVRSSCPTEKEFNQAVKAEYRKRFNSTTNVKTTMRQCQSGWAYGSTQSWLPDAGGMWGDGIQTVLHWNGDRWNVEHLAGSDGLILGEDPVCNQLPRTMQRALCRAA